MKKNFMKRTIAAMLCMAMMLGFIPANVFAEGDSAADYLVLSSDRYGNGGVLGPLLNKVENDIGDGALDYVGLLGDMVSDDADYKTSDILAEIKAQADHMTSSNVDLLFATHDVNVNDDAGIMNRRTGVWMTLDHCYVYGIAEADFANTMSAQLAAERFLDWANSLQDEKAIVVISHMPIHALRGDNLGAGYWHNALNVAATGNSAGGAVQRNIVFLHGHNQNVETNEYYYAPGSNISVESYVSAQGLNAQSDTMTVILDPETGLNATATGTTAKIYYTYATAGYLNANGTATMLKITEDQIVLSKYDTDKTTQRLGTVDRTGTKTKTIGGTLEDGKTEIYATGLALTNMAVEHYENADLTTLFGNTGYMAYGLGLANYIEDSTITVTVKVHGAYLTDAVVYLFDDLSDGQSAHFSLVESTAVYDEATKCSTITFAAPAKQQIIFAYGVQDVEVPEGYVLTDLKVTAPPSVTRYFVRETNPTDEMPLNLSGLVVTATFSNGTDSVTKKIPWDQFESGSGYDLSFNMTEPGDREVIVSYTYEANNTMATSFFIWLGEKEFSNGGVHVQVEKPGTTILHVSQNVPQNIRNAVAALVGKAVAYDITLSSKDNVELDGGKAYVTLPIPAGVTKPVIYHVTEDGLSAHKMECTDNGDGTVTFATEHFSIYVVGQDIELIIPEGTTVMGEKDMTVTEKKYVYVLVGSISAAGEYLIVDKNAESGSANALTAKNGGVTNTDSVQIKKLTQNGSTIYYIENPAAAAVWKAEASGTGWKLSNSAVNATTRYLHYSGSSLTTSTDSSTVWYSKNDTVYKTSSTRYLRYNSGWTTSSSSRTVYIYQKQEVAFTTTARVAGTYGILGNPKDISLVAKEGTTITLGSNLVYYPTTGGSDVADVSTTATYAIAPNGNPAGVIKKLEGNQVTFSGEAGRALVQVSYDTDYGTVTNYIVLDVQAPYYTLELCHREDDNSYVEITGPVALKGIKANDFYKGWARITYFDGTKLEGTDLGDVDDKLIQWQVSNENIARVDPETSNIIFTGTEYGTFTLTAIYVVDNVPLCQDSIIISVTDSLYVVPGDGTEDFPEYPNQGAIRFDKHAVPVGNFNETGIVQLELSMTGVPFTSNNEIDVIIMVDLSTSMDENGRVAAAKTAAQEALKALVTANGSEEEFNGNRVAIYGFNGWYDSESKYASYIEEVYENYPDGTKDPDKHSGANNYNIDLLSPMQTYTAATYQSALNAISNAGTGAGTNYAAALRQCYLTLQATKDANRQQYVIFLTDGAASTGFAYNNNGNKAVYDTGDLGTDGFTMISTVASKQEWYSTLMKEAGVTIYSVGLQISGGSTEKTNAAKQVLQKIAGTKEANATVSGMEDYAIFVESGESATKVVDAFKNITTKIMEAAKDVVVEDVMGEDFVMIFETPNDMLLNNDTLKTQEYFIEVGEYALKADKSRDTYTQRLKLFLGKTGNTYYAAKDSKGTAYATPVFEQKPIGTKYFWSTEASKGDRGVSVEVNGTTYYFTSKGDGTHNMTSGAYATGNVADHYDTGDVNDFTSNDLIIATPYFVYNAATKVLVWTLEKISTTEWTMRYFLYLERSGGYTHTDLAHRQDAGTYPTNLVANMSYVNFQNNAAQVEFPEPQVTWHGAQVTYVFYLVNEKGQPVNRSGRVVPFSEAVYVTDPIRQNIYWNTTETMTRFESKLLAQSLVPSVYTLFDEDAAYTIHAYADEAGINLNNHFKIEATAGISKYTTMVFNTKADDVKYFESGIYKAYGDGKTLTFQGASDEPVAAVIQGGVITSATYNGSEKQIAFHAGYYHGAYQDSSTGYLYYLDADGKAYTIVEKTANYHAAKGFNFYDTTVAFAVVWTPELQSDVVVVDFGLPVIIDVTTNDTLASGVVGVRADAPKDIVMNSGIYTASRKTSAQIRIDSNGDGQKDLVIGTATVESLTSVRFTFHEDVAMQFSEPLTFYYESRISYYDGNELKNVNMYSAVTIVPATTIYYEDNFVHTEIHTEHKYVEFTYVKGGTDNPPRPYYTDSDQGFGKVIVYSDQLKDGQKYYYLEHLHTTENWNQVGTTNTGIFQEADRPGEGKIDSEYDAENIYGYDGAYDKDTDKPNKSIATYSMGSAQMITVKNGVSGKAKFTFWGTGFDMISLTSNTTGTIIVDVFNDKGYLMPGKSFIVDTYYGYVYEDGEWKLQAQTENTLYQVPVIKVDGLEYGKYTAEITLVYGAPFDHGQSEDNSYDFYLDAIRIYNPCDDASIVVDGEAMNPYVEDNEGWPKYQELRDKVINAATALGKDALDGLVFIDGIGDTNNVTDYTNYGPNNELYLLPGQSIAFNVAADTNLADIQIGMKAAVFYEGNSAITYQINGRDRFIYTATEMYYNIREFVIGQNGQDQTIVIKNTGGGILSLTNIKATYKSAPAAVQSLVYVTEETVQNALIMLRGEDPYAVPEIEWPPLAVPQEKGILADLFENLGKIFTNVWNSLFGWIFA